jgi:hypothetical protein
VERSRGSADQWKDHEATYRRNSRQLWVPIGMCHGEWAAPRCRWHVGLQGGVQCGAPASEPLPADGARAGAAERFSRRTLPDAASQAKRTEPPWRVEDDVEWHFRVRELGGTHDLLGVIDVDVTHAVLAHEVRAKRRRHSPRTAHRFSSEYVYTPALHDMWQELFVWVIAAAGVLWVVFGLAYVVALTRRRNTDEGPRPRPGPACSRKRTME